LRSCVCCVYSSFRSSAPFSGTCHGCPIWSTVTILPSPAVTMRPPGAEVLNVSPLPPLIEVTLRDPTDTHRRNGRIRKSHLRLLLTTGRSRSSDHELVRSTLKSVSTSNTLT